MGLSAKKKNVGLYCGRFYHCLPNFKIPEGQYLASQRKDTTCYIHEICHNTADFCNCGIIPWVSRWRVSIRQLLVWVLYHLLDLLWNRTPIKPTLRRPHLQWIALPKLLSLRITRTFQGSLYNLYVFSVLFIYSCKLHVTLHVYIFIYMVN